MILDYLTVKLGLNRLKIGDWRNNKILLERYASHDARADKISERPSSKIIKLISN